METKNKSENQESEILIQEIEQQKIPYLKELSIEELIFLREIGVRFEELKQIIFAKGGLLKGLAAIQWDNQEKKYTRKRNITSTIFIILTNIILVICGLYLHLFFKLQITNIVFLFIILIFLMVNTISLFLSFSMQYTVDNLQKNNKFNDIIVGKVIKPSEIFKLLILYFIFYLLLCASYSYNSNKKIEFLIKNASNSINYWLISFYMMGFVLGLIYAYKSKFLDIFKNMFDKIKLFIKNNLMKIIGMVVMFLLIFINFITSCAACAYFGFFWISFMFTASIVNMLKK